MATLTFLTRMFYTGKLIDYFNKNSKKFLTIRRQNAVKTEEQHKQIIRRFLEYAESVGIFHTSGLNENLLAKYIKEALNKKSKETKRKHKIWLFKMFLKLTGKEVSKYAKNL